MICYIRTLTLPLPLTPPTDAIRDKRRCRVLTIHVASRPQLFRSESQQSIAASDDYYSLSDRTTTSSSRSPSGESRLTVQRYATPNSHPVSSTSSPALSRTHLGANMAGSRSQHSIPEQSRNRNVPPSGPNQARFEHGRLIPVSGMSNESIRQVPNDRYQTTGMPTAHRLPGRTTCHTFDLPLINSRGKTSSRAYRGSPRPQVSILHHSLSYGMQLWASLPVPRNLKEVHYGLQRSDYTMTVRQTGRHRTR